MATVQHTFLSSLVHRSWFPLATALMLSVIDVAIPMPASAADRLVVYSGRAERLIKPVLDAFQATSGVQIDLLSSGTTELVNRLHAEGERTPADVFITNDVGSLEHARALNLLQPLDGKMFDGKIPETFRSPDN